MRRIGTVNIGFNNQENVWLSRAEAADYLRVSKKTLDDWACSKRVLLPYSKVGRRVIYLQRDLDEFLLRNKIGG